MHICNYYTCSFKDETVKQLYVGSHIELHDGHCGFPWCSACEDLSIDVSITTVKLILTKLAWFLPCSTGQNTSKNSISTFWKNIKYLGFHVVVPTREDLSIDVSISYYCSTDIDETKVISALRHKSKFNFVFFLKKIKFSGFHAVVLVKTFPLMYQLLMVINFKILQSNIVLLTNFRSIYCRSSSGLIFFNLIKIYNI